AAFYSRQLRKIILEDRARGGFINLRLYLSPPLSSLKGAQDAGRIYVFIPALKHSHPRECVGGLAMTRDATKSHFSTASPVAAVVLSGNDEAGRQAFHVPFRWSREGFVEIINVESDVPFRCGETTEV